MAEIRYIHAADLHLDAAFTGISRENLCPDLASLLQESTFIALERIVRLCEGQRPDFLVLSGDIYNREDVSIRAQLKLREACERLDALDMPVYMAHGNRDPLFSRFQSLKFPPNVHVFSSDDPEIFEFQGPDNKRALIHGMSHGQDHETRNLASLFKRRDSDAAFQLAVLHCTVENAGVSDSYAPCALTDLKKAGMDAWALGHAHERAVLCDQPFIAFSGNVQALNINETGSRGCLLIRAIEEENGWRCFSEFHSLGPVRCAKLRLNLDQATGQGEVENRLERLIAEELEDADPSVSAIMTRLSISGRTLLDSWLRKDERLAELRGLIETCSSKRIMLALQDVELETKDELGWQESIAREDLLGETARVYAGLAENSLRFKEIRDQALAPLLKRKLLASAIREINDADLLDLLYQAEKLCMEVLENR